METDRRPLNERQALRLLAGMTVGRVVYTVGALPAVLPVLFRLDGEGAVLLSARAGSPFVQAVDDAVVGFETGEVSDTDGSGWSVTVVGRANVLPDPEQVSADGATARPDQVLVRIPPELVTGRRLDPVSG